MSEIRAADELGRRRASAIVRCDDQDTAGQAMEAAVRAGFAVVEFTLTVPGAYELIADFARRDGLVVGAGTVLTVEQAEKSVAAGATFLVSPVVDTVVVRFAVDHGVDVIPGCHTPTEMLLAYDSGARLQKLFPAPAGGPVWLRSVLGPLPFLKVVPTNGIDETNVAAWFEAGAYAAGFASPLFSSELMAARDFAGIEERAAVLLAAVAACQIPLSG